MIRFHRSLQEEKFAEVYQLCRKLMIIFYVWRKKRFSRARVAYDINTPGWEPNNSPFFLNFLEAAQICYENDLSPREYLVALIDYSRNSESFEYNVSEFSIVGLHVPRALDRYIYLSRERITPFSIDGLEEVEDPVEEYQRKMEGMQNSWETLRSSTQSDEMCLTKIGMAELFWIFSKEFLNDISAFRLMCEQGRILPLGKTFKLAEKTDGNNTGTNTQR